MPLTRHLYHSEEVIAALLLCIARGRCKEAAFWALELEDSGYGSTLGEDTLFLAWSRCISLGAPRLLLEAGCRPEKAYRFAQACGNGYKDATVPALLSIQPSSVEPERVGTPAVPPGLAVEEGSREIFLVRAILQGKAALASSVLRTMDPVPWDLLVSVAAWKHGSTGESLLQRIRAAGCRVTAIAILSAKTLSPITPVVQDMGCIALWTPLLGRRARRIYPIPSDCLSYTTLRSSKQSSEPDLLVNLEAALEGAPWWDALKTDTQDDPDEARMQLYDTAFPDDIPDEWSAEERAKSHGVSYTHSSKERFWRMLLGSTPTSKLLWNPTFTPSDPPQSLLPPPAWNFIPVKHRTFIVYE